MPRIPNKFNTFIHSFIHIYEGIHTYTYIYNYREALKYSCKEAPHERRNKNSAQRERKKKTKSILDIWLWNMFAWYKWLYMVKTLATEMFIKKSIFCYGHMQQVLSCSTNQKPKLKRKTNMVKSKTELYLSVRLSVHPSLCPMPCIKRKQSIHDTWNKVWVLSLLFYFSLICLSTLYWDAGPALWAKFLYFKMIS